MRDTKSYVREVEVQPRDLFCAAKNLNPSLYLSFGVSRREGEKRRSYQDSTNGSFIAPMTRWLQRTHMFFSFGFTSKTTAARSTAHIVRRAWAIPVRKTIWYNILMACNDIENVAIRNKEAAVFVVHG
jgi:hypothetical protein